MLSQNAGLRGRIGLHAAVAGGTSLLSVYVACGLVNLPVSAESPVGVNRKNDGRFFFADETHAEAIPGAYSVIYE